MFSAFKLRYTEKLKAHLRLGLFQVAFHFCWSRKNPRHQIQVKEYFLQREEDRTCWHQAACPAPRCRASDTHLPPLPIKSVHIPRRRAPQKHHILFKLLKHLEETAAPILQNWPIKPKIWAAGLEDTRLGNTARVQRLVPYCCWNTLSIIFLSALLKLWPQSSHVRTLGLFMAIFHTSVSASVFLH